MQNKFSKLACLVGLLGLAACEDTTLTPPRSLDGPTAIAIASGNQVCLRVVEIDTYLSPRFDACEGEKTDDDGNVVPAERAAIGLVVNENTDRLTFVDFVGTPRLANLRQHTPGVSHLSVGRLPVDVAASPDGTTAFTLNQLDMDISIVSIWGPLAYSERLSLPNTPIAMEVRPTNGEIVVAVGSPSSLWVHGGATCSSATECNVSQNPVRVQGLRGTVTDFKIVPDGTHAYVAYRDLDEIDVVDLDALSVTQTIPVGYGCSDGVDNDGDGLADAEDPQCFSPLGAESAVDGGIGRKLMGDCSDGMDNDADGLLDRDDPDCTHGGGSEDTRTAIPLTTCNDGVDNDGDGFTDFGQDADCYGPYGTSEEAVVHRGFDKLGTDEFGLFVYALDRARSSVMVIDATRNVLIDAGMGSVPSTDVFSDNFGISVRENPLALDGSIDRRCQSTDYALSSCSTAFFELYEEDTVVVSYSFGAWVAEDTGRLRKVSVMDLDCELPTAEVAKYPDSEFFTDPAALLNSKEANCLVVPEFPLVARDDYAGTCDVECDGEPNENGEKICDEDLLKERFFCSEGTNVTLNPQFGLVDIDGNHAFTSGNSDCSIPTNVTQSMRFFANEANAPRNFLCSSMLLPQPLELSSLDVDRAGFESTAKLRRSDLLFQSHSYLGWINDSIQSRYFTAPIDERVDNERWVVEYEGELPATRRTDGLLDVESTMVDGAAAVRFSTGGLDLCAADVRVGDVFTIKSLPEADGSCDGFRSDSEDFLSFRVLDVEPNAFYFGPLEGNFATELPTRGCFPFGTTYSVRTDSEWVVYGSRSGLIPSTEKLFGECVPLKGAVDPELGIVPNEPTRASRVKTGEVYQGPYLSFYLYPGPDAIDESGDYAIAPERGLVFNFQVEPNFVSKSVRTDGVFPSQIELFQNAGHYRMVSTDADSNFVFWKDVRAGGEAGTRLR